MSAVPPVTTNLRLPLNLHGHYRLVQGVKAAFQIIDETLGALQVPSGLEARLDAIEARLTVIETASNDSNSLHFNGDPG